MNPRRLLLIGGGHSHVEVVRRLAVAPEPRLQLTLVSPDELTPYSGMLPGLVAGHYAVADTHIALAPLAAAAGAAFSRTRVCDLDLAARVARCEDGATIAFDLASIDVGSTPDLAMPGARDHAIGVKPVDRFLVAWERIRADAAAGTLRSLAVIGGGAGGVEILLAMQFRLAQAPASPVPAFALVTDQPELLPQHPPGVRRRLAAILRERGVALHFRSAVAALEPGAAVTRTGKRIAADAFVWATSATAAPWLAASGLACDARGFVRVDAHLRSPSHPFVFAAGDCATQDGHPRPKSGVFAVRQGPPLHANLVRAARAEPLLPYVPQRTALALIATGGRSAIASWRGLATQGDWVWRWKDRIDRGFMARYRFPAGATAVPPPRP